MPTDDELTAALALALDDAAALAPTTTDGRLAAAARRSGRRHRRHRLALTGALTVLALGATGAVVGHLPDGRTAAAAGPAAAPTGNTADDSVRKVAAELAVKLPTGSQPEPPHPGESHLPGTKVKVRTNEFVLDDGRVADGPDPTACYTRDGRAATNCVRVKRPDGSVILVSDFVDSSVSPADRWYVLWADSDGRVREFGGLLIEEMNRQLTEVERADLIAEAMTSSLRH
ncbi:hypothetical protein ACFY00_18680 [Kitasatospora sp. NPDC001540]|uniref:hypothetical protein n=1 Tax=Kitasatospora sp. NPDC001540 TaxID=3364014 RepID=UPI00369270F3